MIDAFFRWIMALFARFCCFFNDDLRKKQHSLEAMERSDRKKHEEAMQEIRRRSREIIKSLNKE